jgi:heat shock protein HslJ
MNVVRNLVCALTLASVLVACGWDDDIDSRVATNGLPSLQEDLEAHEWVLEGEQSEPVVSARHGPVTIAFDDDQVSGRAPCNTYHGPVSIGNEDVEIGELAVTLMACTDPVMEAERAYLDALGEVTRADVDEDGDRMTLEGDGVALHYRSYDADELIVGTWDIVAFVDGDSIVSPLVGSDPTITFEEDGDLRVGTGCNDATSSWTLNGDALEIDPLRLTRRACAEPQGVMDQEAALTSAVEAASRVAVVPGRLTMLDRDDAVVVEATKGGS